MAVPGVVALVALVKNGWLKADRDVGRTDGSMERSSLIKSANAGEKSSTSGGNAIGADCSRASAAKRVRSFDGPVGGAAFANVAAKRGCGRMSSRQIRATAHTSIAGVRETDGLLPTMADTNSGAR